VEGSGLVTRVCCKEWKPGCSMWMMDLFSVGFLVSYFYFKLFCPGLDNRSVFIFATRADGDTYVCRVCIP